MQIHEYIDNDINWPTQNRSYGVSNTHFQLLRNCSTNYLYDLHTSGLYLDFRKTNKVQLRDTR